MSWVKKAEEEGDLGWYTIDPPGLDALNFFLTKDYAGETVRIKVEREVKQPEVETRHGFDKDL